MEDNELKQLIALCKSKDEKGYRLLVDAYKDRLYGYFYRLTSNRALSQDLLSDVFFKIVRKVKSFKEANSFEKWIFTIASNTFYDYLRKKKRQKQLIEDFAATKEAQSTEKATSQKQTEDRLQQALESIDPKIREMVIMRYYSDLSFKEIAEIKKQPIGTVLSQMHRGLKKLRAKMEQKNDY